MAGGLEGVHQVTGTSYTDTLVANGTTYSYTVAAINSYGEGSRSSAASATPGETPPAKLVPTACTNLGDGTTQVQCNIPADQSSIDGYKAYIKQSGSWVQWTNITHYNSSGNFFINLLGTTSGVAYEIAVTAYNTGGESTKATITAYVW